MKLTKEELVEIIPRWPKQICKKEIVRKYGMTWAELDATIRCLPAKTDVAEDGQMLTRYSLEDHRKIFG